MTYQGFRTRALCKIVGDGEDVTSAFDPHLISLQLTTTAGGEAAGIWRDDVVKRGRPENDRADANICPGNLVPSWDEVCPAAGSWGPSPGAACWGDPRIRVKSTRTETTASADSCRSR
jgi:hypothetical protein